MDSPGHSGHFELFNQHRLRNDQHAFEEPLFLLIKLHLQLPPLLYLDGGGASQTPQLSPRLFLAEPAIHLLFPAIHLLLLAIRLLFPSPLDLMMAVRYFILLTYCLPNPSFQCPLARAISLTTMSLMLPGLVAMSVLTPTTTTMEKTSLLQPLHPGAPRQPTNLHRRAAADTEDHLVLGRMRRHCQRCPIKPVVDPGRPEMSGLSSNQRCQRGARSGSAYFAGACYSFDYPPLPQLICPQAAERSGPSHRIEKICKYHK
jgi:hypothetical protein